ALQVSVNPASTEVPGAGKQLLEADDQLILEMGIEVCRSHRRRIRRLAILVVGRVRSVAQRSQALRDTGLRIDAFELEVLARVVPTRGCTNGDVHRHGDMVTAHLAEDLQAGIAIDVPGCTNAWRPLVILLGVRNAIGVVVREALVPETE